MDHFLAEYKEIERFVTQVKGESGTIEVEFTDEYKYGAFPRHLESQVIKKALSIGGVDWSTTGVSEKRFSNSLTQRQGSHRIGLSGYNYDQLYKHAETIVEKIKKNKRVTNIGIELGGSGDWASQDNMADEMYIKYDMKKSHSMI